MNVYFSGKKNQKESTTPNVVQLNRNASLSDSPTVPIQNTKTIHNPTTITTSIDSSSNEFFSDLLTFQTTNMDPALTSIFVQLRNIVTVMNTRFDSLENSINIKIESLVRENKNLQEKLVDLEYKIDKLEQKELGKSVEMFGVPFMQNKVVEDMVCDVIQHGLNIQLSKNDLNKCYRVSNKLNKPGKIIVQFKSADVKNTVLSGARKLKGIPAEILDSQISSGSKIYINENLTFYKKSLFIKAKEAKKLKGYKYLWIRNSRIMIRKENQADIRYINKLGDLDLL